MHCSSFSIIDGILGASSGIGLATVKRLISHGAKVFASDVNDLPEPEKSQVPFMKVDVTSWKEQLDMFKAAKEKYGTIHHVFANAGRAFDPKHIILIDHFQVLRPRQIF